jgi:hypothetical protein
LGIERRQEGDLMCACGVEGVGAVIWRGIMVRGMLRGIFEGPKISRQASRFEEWYGGGSIRGWFCIRLPWRRARHYKSELARVYFVIRPRSFLGFQYRTSTARYWACATATLFKVEF